ncbi:hypothetical protein FRC03_002100 [Tulasnella sp. 419]|nr:hypothetical protein FRC02_012325 [Tulasnella sp. 418]KAG8964205.1 hypothetical protein FRC03_002100 [Tulasnella sp. 419]
MRRNTGPSHPSAPPNSLSSAMRRNLKKNQACLQCRRGKMRCDAAQPHCTNCVKAWQVAVETAGEGVIAPESPSCSYDPVEGLVFTPENIVDPSARIKAIQEQIAQLQGKLAEAKQESVQAGPRSQDASGSRSTSKRRRTLDVTQSSNTMSEVPPTTLASAAITSSNGNNDNLLGDGLWPTMPASVPQQGPDNAGSNTINLADPEQIQSQQVAPRLPPPYVLKQLVNTYFEHDPHASRFLQLRHFHTRLQYTPALEDPRSISPALIHAVCAASLRYCHVDKLRTPFRHNSDPTGRPHSSRSPIPFPSGEWHGDLTSPKDIAELHVVYARQLINAALAQHQHVGLLDPELIGTHPDAIDTEEEAERLKAARDAFTFRHVLQPLLVLATFYYQEARGVEMWSTVGAAVRTGMALGLNHPPDAPISDMDIDSLATTPTDRLYTEERKRAFWMCFILDRLVSIGGWTHSLAEADSVAHYRGSTPLLSAREFRELGSEITTQGPATQPADSFCLLADAAFLLGRVTEFNIRRLMRSKSLKSSSRPSSSSSASSNGTAPNALFSQAGFGMRNTPDPLLTWDFRELDMTLAKGVEGFGNATSHGGLRPAAVGIHGNPTVSARFKYPIGIIDKYVNCEETPVAGGRPRSQSQSSGMANRSTLSDGTLDTDLYLTHVIPHAATILLHIPYARFDREPVPHDSPSQLSAGVRLAMGVSQNSHLPLNAALFNNVSLPLPQSPRQAESPLGPGSQDRQSVASHFGLAEDCTVASTSKCIKAARRILDALVLLKATNFDLTLLHPFITTCWYLATVVLLHEYKRLSDNGQEAAVTAIGQEILLLRQALQEYGIKSPIGNHHEQQLQSAINSILIPPASPISRPSSARQASLPQMADPTFMGLLMPDSNPFAFSQPNTRTSSPAPPPPPQTPQSISILVFPFDREPRQSRITTGGFGQAAPLPDILIDHS